jgi:hypothetical protein
MQLFELAETRLIRRLAYVAARDEKGSSPEVLHTIGLRLGKLTTIDTTVKVIAAPLLGTGAGRVPLISAVQALTDGFRVFAAPDSLLSLCVPRYDSFRKLTEWYSKLQVSSRPALRVFLSYNQATQSPWVQGLHEFLRGQGIDARVDVWDLKMMMDLNDWMSQEIALADKVIIISDEAYAKKADNYEGGVGEETRAIEADLKSSKFSDKYIGVVRSDSVDTGTPAYLSRRFMIHCCSDEHTAADYQKILKQLYGDSRVPPPLGKRPLYLKE